MLRPARGRARATNRIDSSPFQLLHGAAWRRGAFGRGVQLAAQEREVFEKLEEHSLQLAVSNSGDLLREGRKHARAVPLSVAATNPCLEHGELLNTSRDLWRAGVLVVEHREDLVERGELEQVVRGNNLVGLSGRLLIMARGPLGSWAQAGSFRSTNGIALPGPKRSGPAAATYEPESLPPSNRGAAIGARIGTAIIARPRPHADWAVPIARCAARVRVRFEAEHRPPVGHRGTPPYGETLVDEPPVLPLVAVPPLLLLLLPLLLLLVAAVDVVEPPPAPPLRLTGPPPVPHGVHMLKVGSK